MKVKNTVFSLLLFVLLGMATSANALTKQQALLILGRDVLRPSNGLEQISARMLPAPLFVGTVRPRFRATPTISIPAISGNPQWFVLVDLFPCALFEHDVLYVFIDDVTGALAVFAATDWPTIDGVMFGEGVDYIQVFPLLPRPFPITALASATAPVGDYGDAPDNQAAYIGVLGRFPTLFATTNSVLSRPGGHTLITGQEMLGKEVSREKDARDPFDPDLRPNLVNADSDERMFLAWDPTTVPATSYLIYDVTIAPGAPNVSRFVNVLFDFDRSGNWSGAAAGTEWAIQNQGVNVAPGTTATQISPQFNWGNGTTIPTQVWARVALTRALINPNDFLSVGGWDGSGEFAFGEIEDFEVYLSDCPSLDHLPPPPPPPGVVGPVPPGRQPLKPGPQLGWNGLPIKYFAIVINGPDNPKQGFLREGAAAMTALLGAQGYMVTKESEPTAQTIRTDLINILNQVVCQDRIVIYIAAHGLKNRPGGTIVLRNDELFSGFGPNGLKEFLDLILPCRNLPCDATKKCCNITVILDSCFSGQWQDSLFGDGRDIITSSSRTEFSWSAGGFGMEFGNGLRACSSDFRADTNRDKSVTLPEAFNWAVPRLRTPEPTHPAMNDMTCPCICPDPDVPVCFLQSILTGTPPRFQIGIQDIGSGLKSITVVSAINVKVVIDPFVIGTRNPVTVTVTLTDPSKPGLLILKGEDLFGNIAFWDPAIGNFVLTDGTPVTRTFSGLPPSDNKIIIRNGSPGLTTLEVFVNGRKVRDVALTDNQSLTVDVASAMVPGSNTITLTAHGPVGAKATVLITE